MRLIDADKLHNARLRAIRAYENANIFNPKAIRENIKPLLDIIVDTPTINPDDLVKHGEWIEYINSIGKTQNFHVCSECGCEAPCNSAGIEKLSKYCYNCGAKMDGKKEIK